MLAEVKDANDELDAAGSPHYFAPMLNRTLLVLWLLLTGVIAGFGQGIAQSPSSSVNALMIRLFGDQPFTATAHVAMTNKASGPARFVMPLTFSGGKLRAEMDMTKVDSAQMQPEALQQIRMMGMDKIVSVILPESKSTLLIYPGLNSVITMPLPKEEAAALSKDYKFTKTSLGKETVEGESAEKEKYIFGEQPGDQQTMTVWRSTKNKGFPIRLLMVDPDNSVQMTFKDYKPGTQDAKLFQPPANYAQYTNMMQLQQVMMRKLMGGAQQPPR